MTNILYKYNSWIHGPYTHVFFNIHIHISLGLKSLGDMMISTAPPRPSQDMGCGTSELSEVEKWNDWILGSFFSTGALRLQECFFPIFSYFCWEGHSYFVLNFLIIWGWLKMCYCWTTLSAIWCVLVEVPSIRSKIKEFNDGRGHRCGMAPARIIRDIRDILLKIPVVLSLKLTT